MLRKQVEIEGKSYTLGEVTAAVLEDAQDAEEAFQGQPDAHRQKLALMRSVIAQGLNRGGFAITAEELRAQFSYTELGVFWVAVMELSGIRQVKEGEAQGP